MIRVRGGVVSKRNFPVDFPEEFYEDLRREQGMKKIVLGFMILYLANAGFVWGGGFSMQASGGVIFPNEGNDNLAFAFGFGLNCSLSQKLWVSFGLGYWKSSVGEKPGKLYEGKLNATPFLVSVHYSMLKERKFVPYVFVGLGYILYDLWLEDIVTIPEITVMQKVENDPVCFGGIGGQAQFWDKILLFVETSYFYSKPEGKTIVSDMNFGVFKEEFSLDMRTIHIRFGVKYQF